jgi:hypothetical protein
VPRYFFHIYEDEVIRDEEGVVLADAEAARRQAMAGIRDMMCGQVREGRLVLHYRVEVEDDAGAPVLVIPYAEAVAIER